MPDPVRNIAIPVGLNGIRLPDETVVARLHQPLPLKSLADLHTNEVNILRMIQAVPHGTELFIADPVRFLNEHGYPVDPALESVLRAKTATATSHLADRYTAIRDGHGALSEGPAYYRVRYHVRALGVKP